LSKAQTGEGNQTTPELLREARHLLNNLPSDPSARQHYVNKARRLLKVFHFRLAVPTMCLVLPFLAIPLALWTRSGRKSFAFGLSILSVFVYYVLLTLGKALMKDGTVSPLVGSWMPVVVLFAIGIVLTWKVTRH
jgi:lipopolysaccharide export LptBFGC system permease protein LptF